MRTRFGTLAPLWLILALALVWALYATVSRRREDRALRDAAIPHCTAATGDVAKCEAQLARDHDHCRLLSMTYHGKRNGTSLSQETYADCVTRGADTVTAERVAQRKAQEEAARQRGAVLR